MDTEIEDPELIFELPGDCQCACENVVYGPGYTTCLQVRYMCLYMKTKKTVRYSMVFITRLPVNQNEFGVCVAPSPILIDANDYECCYIRIEYAWVYLWKSTSRCCTNCARLFFAIKIDKYISRVDLTITSELRY